LRLTNPGVGRWKKEVKSKPALTVSLTALFAALYAVGVVALAPISFYIFQVRVVDALLPLAVLFGWPAVLGLSLGAFVANFFGGLGWVDVVGGAFANFVATYAAWRIGQRRARGMWLLAVVTEIVVVSLIVGGYLSYLFQMPLEVGVIGVLTGGVVAIGVLGYALLLVMSRSVVAGRLRSFGLIGYLEKRQT
jgi:uncharacterized membrane protein